ncbi:hypothetical protein HK097_003047 [Rhizophlyctis rosea]|uniref:Uncharacterized protein n=1 Tax=Rhizophlyctis rosea TaxID=64517 RepID=A0AAD5SLB4_9FUNG|nr:hypothetical protein HK097_003047 [Rhizophlyctis rosea]
MAPKLIAASLLLSLLSSVSAQAPAAVPTSSVPNATECELRNWDLGDRKDPNEPPKPWPVSGQQVYLADEQNFCIVLPDPNNEYIKYFWYNQGKKPTIVEGEGYVHAFCVGNYTTPGASPMPAGAITAAHVENHLNNPVGKRYIQITGRMDCDKLNINCIGSAPGAYDDGGQYDDVPYRKCGKEPYSGHDHSKHPDLVHYVEQAGNGIFCMRICDGGNQLEDPCNVKNDTAGCFHTMNMTDRDGFSYFDAATGFVRNSTPTLNNPTATTTTASSTSASGTGSAAASPTGTGNNNGAQGSSGGVVRVVAGGMALATALLAGLLTVM